MDAHNLSVCLSPNLFQTKQNCKVIHQQTSAVEICIQNVLNIGGSKVKNRSSLVRSTCHAGVTSGAGATPYADKRTKIDLGHRISALIRDNKSFLF